jgi:class 3 adenylate cyclase
VPRFIDRHDAPGLTPEEVAEGHRIDTEIEDQYGVHYYAYWFDPEAGTVFCLADGPSKEAVDAVHVRAHGIGAPVILEIDEATPLNEFFGTVPSHPVGTPYTAPALRIIVFTDVCGSVRRTQELGDDGYLAFLRDHNEIVRQRLARHDGREVKHTGDGIMAAFNSVVSALAFAVAVQQALDERNQHAAVPLELRIGMSAGEPVTDDHDDLFGATVNLAKRLCDCASAGDIFVSLGVRELCAGKQFLFEDRGQFELKGIAEPVPTYALVWRQ